MTIDLSQETQSLLDKALESGQFQSAEQAIQYSLRRALMDQTVPTDEAYDKYLRGLLGESEQAVKEGRVQSYTTETQDDFWDDLKQRGKERLAASKQTS